MSWRIDRILAALSSVDRLRASHAADAALRQQVIALKDYQSRRFARTYADLLVHPRSGAAARFFLQELYGPHEFADRDAQFARVVPSIVHLFPGELGETIESLAELHALSEMFDDAMARHLRGVDPIVARSYVRAWQATGEPESRRRQIALTLAVGRALDRYTRWRLLRTTLHMMRVPARAAGLGALQRFLEVGFDAFSEMGGAAEFLATIDSRERAFADALEGSAARAWACSGAGPRPDGDALEQLP